MSTIAITRLGNGSVSIVVNSLAPRILANGTNIIIEPGVGNLSVMVRTTDERFRQEFFLTDTITIGGVAAPALLNDLAIVLANNVFSGATTFATPAKLAQTITFSAPASVVHTAPPIILTGTASSGLTVSYASSDTAVFTISGSVLTPVGAGTANITASQAGNAIFNAATDVVVPYTLT